LIAVDFRLLCAVAAIMSACARATPAGDVANQDPGDVALVPSVAALPRLVTAGQYLRMATGERFSVVEASDFNILGRLANGEDIEPLLEQRSRAGFNTLRVFTAYDLANGIGRLVPREHPDLYTELIPALAQLAARHHLYLELVGFTGTCYQPPACPDNYRITFPGGADDMVAHWNHLIAAAAGQSNVLLELINEHDHHANAGIPLDRLTRPPPPTLASHGSGTQGAMPLFPLWDYATFHASAPREVVHRGWSDVAGPNHIPVVVNETVRVPDNDRNLAHAQDIARGCALLVAGCAFHSVHGKSSELWSGVELEYATEFARSARSVPLEFQDGPAVHREDLEAGCDCSAVYSKRLPDGREFIAPIRR
jgi:hypothetical protein